MNLTLTPPRLFDGNALGISIKKAGVIHSFNSIPGINAGAMDFFLNLTSSLLKKTNISSSLIIKDFQQTDSLQIFNSLNSSENEKRLNIFPVKKDATFGSRFFFLKSENGVLKEKRMVK